MAHVTHHHGQPVRWTLLAHGKATETYVDWYAVGISTSATEDGYACGMVVVMNEKLFRELENDGTCPDGLLEATIAKLHERGHNVLLRLLGHPGSGEDDDVAEG